MSSVRFPFPSGGGSRLAALFAKPWIVPAAVLVSLALRLALVATIGRHARFSDEDDYWSLAQSLVHGHGYTLFGHTTAYRPPAMPLLLSAGILVFGPHYQLMAFFDAVLLCLLPFLVLWTGEAFGLPRPWAAFAAVLAAFHPGLNYAATTLYPTALTTVALVLASLLTLRAIRRNSLGEAALAGLAAGLAAAATTIFGPFGLMLAAAAAVRRRGRLALAIAAFSLLPTAAWVARNHRVLGTTAVATNGGFNMELGANDRATPRSGNLIRPEITPQEPTGTEVDWDHDHHARATAWIKAHPLRFAGLFALRGAVVLDSVGRPATPGMQNSVSVRLIGWAMLPFLLLGLAGLAISRRAPLAWITAGALLLVVVSSGLTIVKPRFRFPCDPLLAIFAVVGLRALLPGPDARTEPVDDLRSPRRAPWSPPAPPLSRHPLPLTGYSGRTRRNGLAWGSSPARPLANLSHSPPTSRQICSAGQP